MVVLLDATQWILADRLPNPAVLHVTNMAIVQFRGVVFIAARIQLPMAETDISVPACVSTHTRTETEPRTAAHDPRE